MIFETGIDEVGTYGAYHNGYFKKRDVLIFPYINTHLTTAHPLNKSGSFVFLDYCYIVIFDPVFIKEMEMEYEEYDFSTFNKPDIISLGGVNITDKHDTGFIIRCSRAFLQVEENYTFSKDLFIPVDMPLLKRNMDEEKVSLFFNPDNFPSNLKKLLE